VGILIQDGSIMVVFSPNINHIRMYLCFFNA
jgi:hypothetical protein